MTEITVEERRAKLSKLSKPELVEIILRLCLYFFGRGYLEQALKDVRYAEMERRIEAAWAYYEKCSADSMAMVSPKTTRELMKKMETYHKADAAFKKWNSLHERSIKIIDDPWHGL